MDRRVNQAAPDMVWEATSDYSGWNVAADTPRWAESDVWLARDRPTPESGRHSAMASTKRVGQMARISRRCQMATLA